MSDKSYPAVNRQIIREPLSWMDLIINSDINDAFREVRARLQ